MRKPNKADKNYCPECGVFLPSENHKPMCTYTSSQVKHGPSLALLVKLGSIVVHADELSGPLGHPFDNITMQQLIKDPDVQQWIKDMGPLLPQKRNKPV